MNDFMKSDGIIGLGPLQKDDPDLRKQDLFVDELFTDGLIDK